MNPSKDDFKKIIESTDFLSVLGGRVTHCKLSVCPFVRPSLCAVCKW